VHDEVVFSLPQGEIDSGIIKDIERAMEVTDGYAVPLSVESSGPYDRWGEKFIVKAAA
jgi:DNA polymerase I-like protein with 3'-5' exonuclease and polymerase domains